MDRNWGWIPSPEPRPSKGLIQPLHLSVPPGPPPPRAADPSPDRARGLAPAQGIAAPARAALDREHWFRRVENQAYRARALRSVSQVLPFPCAKSLDTATDQAPSSHQH